MRHNQNWEEEYFGEIFRKHMSQFSLYKENHFVESKLFNDYLRFWYQTKKGKLEPQTKATLGIDLTSKVGQVLYLGIDPRLRGKGFGRELYSKAEEFFEDMKREEIVLRATDDGLGFWPKMGYRPVEGNNDRKMIKVLEQRDIKKYREETKNCIY